MKKLLILFLSLLAIGGIFQACDNSKTYAEMLEDEKNAVNQFISDSAIHVISLEEFEKDTFTMAKANGDPYDEYVAFSNGIYMQIVKRDTITDRATVSLPSNNFLNNNNIIVRYLEKDIMTRELTCFNVFLPEYADATQLYTNPAVFRYVNDGTYSAYGIFTQMDYYWASYYQTTAVPVGWLLALPYVRNGAHVRMIIPSKMGHSNSQQYVTPFYYDIQEFSNAAS